MDYDKLFEAQQKLDEHIINEKNLKGQDLLKYKVEALLCEIQETANEVRDFKYWSNKPPNMENALEETVDVLHFLLSIGNDLNVTPSSVEEQPAWVYQDLTEQFLALSYTAACIVMFMDKEMYYLETIKLFKGLVHLLKFTNEQLEQAYYDKNKENHNRQESGTY